MYEFCQQIKQESFLEDINNLLNAGEVPNLYPLDEKQEICEKMRQLDRFVTPIITIIFVGYYSKEHLHGDYLIT